MKDISKLGRDLAKTIIVDNIPENFQLQAENGIFIKSWFRDPDDCALFELMPLLGGKLTCNSRNSTEKCVRRQSCVKKIQR